MCRPIITYLLIECIAHVRLPPRAIVPAQRTGRTNSMWPQGMTRRYYGHLPNYFGHLLTLLVLGRIACTQCIKCGLLLQMSHVAWYVCMYVSVCVLGIWVTCTKTAEPIEMPFERPTHVDPRNHVLDGGPDPHGKGNFGGRHVSAHCNVYLRISELRMFSYRRGRMCLPSVRCSILWICYLLARHRRCGVPKRQPGQAGYGDQCDARVRDVRR